MALVRHRTLRPHLTRKGKPMDWNRIAPRAWRWGLVALLATFAAGCGSGDDGKIFGAVTSTAGVPVLPGAACAITGLLIPTVTSSNPTAGNQFVPTSTNGVANSGKLVSASFSLPMAPATLNSNPAGTLPTFTLRETVSTLNVPGTVALDAGGTTATYTTGAALLPDTDYTATITVVATSVGGTPLGCIVAWTFKTTLLASTGLAAIDLGILAPFGIASAGGITNSGPTKINGDTVLAPLGECNTVAVGTGNDFGICGGLAPTNNAGDRVITQTFPDATTADAVMAVLLAKWNSLTMANLPGATVLGCGTIGTAGGGGAGVGCAGNATLPPGVYISATNSSIDISGTLTLDGGGNADAVFVFQAPSSTVISAVGSTILLTGGTKASNVFWQVGSSATVNAGSVFQGNILASASVSMGTLATSCGRLLSGAEGFGAFTFLSNTVSVPGHPNAPVGCQ
jgi:hypothetical protein